MRFMRNALSLEVNAQPIDLVFLFGPSHLLHPAALWPSSYDGAETNLTSIRFAAAPLVQERAPDGRRASSISNSIHSCIMVGPAYFANRIMKEVYVNIDVMPGRSPQISMAWTSGNVRIQLSRLGGIVKWHISPTISSHRCFGVQPPARACRQVISNAPSVKGSMYDTTWSHSMSAGPRRVVKMVGVSK